MSNLEQLKLLFELSYKLYKDCAEERHALHNEEWELNISPLGEIELFSDDIAGIAYSICNGRIPVKKLGALQSISITSIAHYEMVEKYPAIIKDIENWEKIRVLCIDYLEEN